MASVKVTVRVPLLSSKLAMVRLFLTRLLFGLPMPWGGYWPAISALPPGGIASFR